MRIVSVAEVKAKLSAYLRASRRGPVVVTRNGKAVAVLLSVDNDDEVEDIVLANSPKFRAVVTEARDQLARGEGIAHEQFWTDLERTGPSSRAAAKPARRATRRG
jgi:prevent-host-death family protein